MTGHRVEVQQIRDLSELLDDYRPARQRMVAALGLPASNRDPLAKWSEHFVAALTRGSLAPSRVQAAYDLITPGWLRVRLRYLANADPNWVNEQHIQIPVGADQYALIIFEAFEVVGALLFPSDLTAICGKLGKRHGNQSTSLQFTRRNWWKVRDNPDQFRKLDMLVWLPPFGPPQ